MRIVANRSINSEHDLKASDLSLLARTLSRTSHSKTARDMLLAAARLRDESAVLLVIQAAVEQGSLGAPGVGFLYKACFQPLVEKGNPRALYIEAQLCERQQQNGKALSLYEKLVGVGPKESADTEGYVDYGAAWMAISKLKAQKGDRDGVKEAIDKAALQHDNPTAYYQIAKAFTKSPAEYEGFLLKAAVSGEIKAAHGLGVLYFYQSLGRFPPGNLTASNKKSIANKDKLEEEAISPEEKQAVTSSAAAEKRKIAQQWFALGADADLTGSQVYLACLLHKSKDVESGLQWLKAACNSKDFVKWEKVVTFLGQKWNSADYDISRIDIEGLRNGSVPISVSTNAKG